MNRRAFVTGLAAALAASVSGLKLVAGARRRPRILLRGSWQTVNIGDIGHTPGILRLLGDHLPEAEITLWPSNIGDGVEELLRRNFPQLKFAMSPAEVERAFAECDFLLHGSGSGFVAQKHVAQWAKTTDKPYGIYGISFFSTDLQAKELLTKARFVFFRDGVSLQFAKDQDVACPVMEFGPDSAFGVNLRNDQPAEEYLRSHGLEEGQFLCCIPRLRYTPYWKIKKNVPFDEKKHARNEEMQEHDHAPLRAAITAVVRETPMKVLLCPEDKSQIAVGKELVFDPLPDDVKQRVVWRDRYWLTDEALSTYVRSAGLFGNEMHSPIMCIGNGIPAIVCRFDEQTSKGTMWRDIGLGDWLFNLDDEQQVAKITATVLELAKNPAAAKEKAAQALKFVQQRQRETMEIVKQNVSAAE
jgi:polysaccharide pyruvyl transferase WcaK-like protein